MSSHSKVHPEPTMDGNDSPQPVLTGDDEDTDDERVDAAILSAVDRRVSNQLCTKIREQASRLPQASASTWTQHSEIHREHKEHLSDSENDTSPLRHLLANQYIPLSKMASP